MKRTTSAWPKPFEQPYILFLGYAGVGVGTVLLAQPVRLAILWTLLAGLCIAYRVRTTIELDFSLINIGRGALLGLAISLPLLAFFSKQLHVFNERLYATRDVVFLFYQVCFVSAPIEEFFFRGIVQQHHGTSISIALYAIAALIYFAPKAPILAAFIVFVALGVLGIVYSYVRDRYGLTAAIAAHVVVGFVLQVMPLLLASVRILLA